MRFFLPAVPSASVNALLQGACQELKRAGDQAVPAEALQVWEWELLGAALNCLNQLLSASSLSSANGHSLSAATSSSTSNGNGRTLSGVLTPSLESRLSEKGVLQLLFDVRLVRDILQGGRPLSPAQTQGGGSTGAAATTAPALLDPQDASVLAALADRRRAVTLLEQQLQVSHQCVYVCIRACGHQSLLHIRHS